MNQIKWDIEVEYPSLSSAEFKKDVESNRNSLKELKLILNELSVSQNKVDILETLFLKITSAFIIQYNIITYLNCLLSVDSLNSEAEKELSLAKVLHSELNQIYQKLKLAFIDLSESEFMALKKKESLKSFHFYFDQSLSRKVFLLSENEEILIEALSNSGPEAWSNLYNKIGGAMTCKIQNSQGETEEVGLSKAHSLMRSADESIRKSAWTSIQESWKSQQITAASILNHLAGWRLQITEKRSHTQEMHFLNNALFRNKISEKTLNAMMTSVRNHKSEIQKAGLLMAQTLQKEKLDPWDLLAPFPKKMTSSYTYEEAIHIIKKALSEVSSEMSDFVQMMVDKNWIEARVLPNKRTGAFCTGFQKSKTPRVFMTFMGSSHDVSTLAHELGHAYHSWIMRDLEFNETNFPSTLAETASIFFETLLRDVMCKNAKTPEEKLSYLWNEIESALGTIINISARFEFEYNFHEERKKAELSPKETCKLMDQAWRNWYGETLSQTDSYYWAHKLHFSMTREFYNFPYTFGYLFALSIYARREALGSSFLNAYKNILMDTGRMTAEDLIQKHLHEDITQVEFWDKAIQIVIGKINEYERIKNKLRAL